ncbi:MAG: M1 family aminopeptidase [Bacteroidota bacterium]|nr:M1 family aminopeptidase [Bacteroidota bacterium]
MNSIQFQLDESLTADSALFESKTTAINHTGNVITIPLNTAIIGGRLDSITIFYHGVPGLSGFGSFENYVHNGAPSMWTLSEPYGASDWWPSKNDLTDKIDSIDIYVVMPKGNHAASNGILVSETPYNANSTFAHWKHRYPIASYLIAIGVTNYARYSDYYRAGSDSIEILNYVYPEDSAELRASTADAVKSMALFEQLFSPYPFTKEKYGHAQCNLQGGMEHQTMTFLGKNQFNPNVITHELAHQWFGDMITCGSWQDIWLNEGFATYCSGLSNEYLSGENKFKDWINALRKEVVSNQQGSVFCPDTTDISRIFSNELTYYKGALLLHMLRWLLGDIDFFQSIRNYLNDPELKNGFAHTSDLKKHLENQSGKDLTRFFADWFYGTGVPSYVVHIDQQPNLSTLVTINQTQYNSNVSFFDMVLPIEFKGEKNDTIILFDHTYSGQTFESKLDFRIDSVLFDPEDKILYNQSEVTLNYISQNQIEYGDRILISPNPSGKLLKIQYKSESINYLQIFNLNGCPEITIPTKQTDSFLELNIQRLQSGMYILKVGTTECIETKKFIVIR